MFIQSCISSVWGAGRQIFVNGWIFIDYLKATTIWQIERTGSLGVYIVIKLQFSMTLLVIIFTFHIICVTELTRAKDLCGNIIWGYHLLKPLLMQLKQICSVYKWHSRETNLVFIYFQLCIRVRGFWEICPLHTLPCHKCWPSGNNADKILGYTQLKWKQTNC